MLLLGGNRAISLKMQYSFGPFVLDGDRFELTGDGKTLPLEPKNFRLLRFLVENRHRVVAKEEVFASVWPGVIVSDASLSTAIRQIRKALGDDAQKQAFVRTVRGQGVRFVASVKEIQGPAYHSSTDEQSSDELASPQGDGRPAIAVLPFSLLGTNELHQAIAEAIPGELIATLSRLRWIKVIARASSFQLYGLKTDLDLVRARLNATYALSGTVELQHTNLTVTVELADTHSHQLIWSERYSSPLEGVFALREKIAREVTSGLELRLPLHEAERLKHLPSESLDAWGHYHLGVRHMNHYRKADNLIAEGHFKQAIALDPQFARAHAALSYTEFQNCFQMFGQDLNHHRNLALKHAEQAVTLDELDPFGNLNLGRANWLFGDVESGIGWVDRSLQLNPNYAFGFYNSGLFNTVLGDSATADAHVDAAHGLSPLDPHTQSMMAIRALLAFLDDDIPLACEHIERAVRAPNLHLYVYTIAAVVYKSMNKLERVRSCLDMIRRKNAAFTKEEVLSYYDLRIPQAKAKFANALEELGL